MKINPTNLINFSPNREMNLFLKVYFTSFCSLLASSNFEHASIDSWYIEI